MIHRFSSIKIRIATAFVVVVEMEKTILRFIWNCKRLQVGGKNKRETKLEHSYLLIAKVIITLNTQNHDMILVKVRNRPID